MAGVTQAGIPCVLGHVEYLATGETLPVPMTFPSEACVCRAALTEAES